MTSKLGLIDMMAAMPEIFLLSMIVVILLYESFRKDSGHQQLYVLSLVALVGTGILAFAQMNSGIVHFSSDMPDLINGQETLSLWFGEVSYSSSAAFLKLMVIAIVAIGLIYSYPRLEMDGLAIPEFYLLTLLSTLGMVVMVSAATMLTLYLGLELMSLPLYGLAALNRNNSRGVEAAMKYFVMGAMASGILLFGVALLYGATGSFVLSEIADFMVQNAIEEGGMSNKLLLFSMIFIIVGVTFKLGAAPFHAWVPDVYEGSPAPVALLISAAPKVAAFVMASALLLVSARNLVEDWQLVLSAIAIVSFVLGNLIALKQDNLRRMLGYSAVSHAGFMLLGLFLDDKSGYSSGLFYAITYALTTTAAFGFVLMVKNNGNAVENIDELKGFGREHGWLALLMAAVMFSMGGIPFFVGFQGKLLVLKSAFQAGFIWTVIIGLIMSVIGLFYYLRVVKVMFFDETVAENELTVDAPATSRVFLSLNVFALAVLGVMPGLLLAFC